MIKIKEEKILVRPTDLKPSSDKLEVIGTINPAAIRLPNGEILLYVRVIEKLIQDEDERHYYSPRTIGKEKYVLKIDRFNKKNVTLKTKFDFLFDDDTKRLTFISYLKRVFLDKSGKKVISMDKDPSFYGISWDGELGIEDPRITKLDDIYVMTYVGLARATNISTCVAISHDCIHWHRRGIIFKEQNKDVVIFPDLINKKYIAIDRPEGNFQFSSPHMWISDSKDLYRWSSGSPLKLSKVPEWDSGRVGAGPPPIKTEKGWLLFYHGVHTKDVVTDKQPIAFLKNIIGINPNTEKRFIYAAGAVLLDLKNPFKILAKTNEPIIIPKKKYEKVGLEPKEVIFPTGAIIDENKNDILLYSGAGDILTTLKRISIKDVFHHLQKPE